MANPDYSLKFNEGELQRFRMMAARAVAQEGELWATAGISAGAHIADVGCGVGAALVELARIVGPEGRATGIEPGAEFRPVAETQLRDAGLSNWEVRDGTGTATGLDPDSQDAIMMRHVLIHNGGREAEILGHLKSRLKPGGCLILAESDGGAIHMAGIAPEVQEATEAYHAMLLKKGNDVRIGPRLAPLCAAAGLTVEVVAPRVDTVPAAAIAGGSGGPAFASRGEIIRLGAATEADFQRWEQAMERPPITDGSAFGYVPLYCVVARRP